MPDAAQLAQDHWNETPLFLSEQERYSTYPWLYDVAEFREHAGEKVLEIGCGTGADLLQFAKHGAIATGVDLTEKHIALARERVGNLANVQRADMRHLPFADDSFDYIYSHGVLMCSDEPEKVVREMLPCSSSRRQDQRSCLRFLVVFHAVAAFLRYGRGFKLHFENSLAPVHVDLYTARKLRRLFGPRSRSKSTSASRSSSWHHYSVGFW